MNVVIERCDREFDMEVSFIRNKDIKSTIEGFFQRAFDAEGVEDVPKIVMDKVIDIIMLNFRNYDENVFKRYKFDSNDMKETSEFSNFLKIEMDLGDGTEILFDGNEIILRLCYNYQIRFEEIPETIS